MSAFASGWDSDLAAAFFPVWAQRGYITESFVPVDELVRMVDSVVQCNAATAISSVSVLPRERG